MKKRSNFKLFILTLILLAVAFVFCANAEGEIASGSFCETVTYKIINEGSEEKPSYLLLIEGSGDFRGLDNEGNFLKYDTRKNSILAPYAEHIKSAEIGEGITAMGNYSLAFLGALKSVTIPSTLTEIGPAALQDCHELTRISYKGDERELIDLSGIKTIKPYAFTGCYAMKKVIFSEELTGTLGKQTFYNCRSLTSVTLPEGVTSIGEECFRNCISMRYVKILAPNALVDSNAAKDAENIYFVCPYNTETYGNLKESGNKWGGERPGDIPFSPPENAVASGSLGEGIFWEIVPMEGHTEDSPKYSLKFRGDGTSLALKDKWGNVIGFGTYKNGPFAEYLPHIKEAHIEAPITQIRGNVFTGMTTLKSVEIPATLSRLDGAIFEHATALSSVYLEGSEPISGKFDMSRVVWISAYCFDGCYGMTEFVFSEDFENENILTETFKGCRGLKTFTVPSTIKKIDKNAFLDCTALEEVIFEADTALDPEAFNKCEALKRMRGFSDSSAESFALEANIEFLYPCEVAIRSLETKKLINVIEVVAGAGIYDLSFDGKICLAYTDAEGKEPYVIGSAINSTETIYVSPILSLDSLKARAADEIGLKALFSLSDNLVAKRYTVAEAGAIASRDRGSSDIPIDLGMNGIFKAVFASEGKLISPLSSPKVDNYRIGFTAKGFTDEGGALIPARCAERLAFRGYAIIRDNISGEEYTVYTHMLKESLYESASKACAEGIGAYSTTDKELLSSVAALAECERKPITKAESLEIVEMIATGYLKALRSDDISIDSSLSVEQYLSEKYNESGDVAAILRFDASDVYDSGIKDDATIKAIAESFADLAAIGGSPLIYLRPNNPLRAGSTGGDFSSSDWESIFVSGTPQNNAYLSELGKTGRFLQQLKEAGVNVYVNLLPEISGSRWWCKAYDGIEEDTIVERYISLYRYTVDYFEKDCSLDNIIWIYEGGSNGEDFFPGDSHADIYNGDFESSKGVTTLYQLIRKEQG